MPESQSSLHTIPTKSVYDPSIDSTPTEENLKNVWKNLTITERRGQAVIEKSLTNLKTIIRYDKTLSGLCYNEITNQIEIHAKPPWDRDETLILWDERDTINLRDYIASVYTLEYSKQDIEDYALYAADLRRFNPIKKYLESLPPWDGVSRVSTLFIDYFGAEDNSYVRDVALKWAVAAIKRVYQPGCKYDNVPVLSGPQGIGKSTFFHKLGKQWFSDSLTFTDMADTKKAGEKIQRTWINEISELNGIRKQDIGTVKNFISSPVDIYRAAYGRDAKEYPRRCVLIGTTNDDNFLFDDTGNRRFQPIRVTGEGKYDPIKITDETVDQIWAEAVHIYVENPDIELCLEKENQNIAEKAQMDALESSELEGLIGFYLDMLLPENWEEFTSSMRINYIETYHNPDINYSEPRVKRTRVSILEIHCECLREPVDRMTRSEQMNIARCLTKLHWARGKGSQHLKDGTKNPFPEQQTINRYGRCRMWYPYDDIQKFKEHGNTSDEQSE